MSARAAIEAMREPTSQMRALDIDEAEWRMLIDAALADAPQDDDSAGGDHAE